MLIRSPITGSPLADFDKVDVTWLDVIPTAFQLIYQLLLIIKWSMEIADISRTVRASTSNQNQPFWNIPAPDVLNLRFWKKYKKVVHSSDYHSINL